MTASDIAQVLAMLRLAGLTDYGRVKTIADQVDEAEVYAMVLEHVHVDQRAMVKAVVATGRRDLPSAPELLQMFAPRDGWVDGWEQVACRVARVGRFEWDNPDASNRVEFDPTTAIVAAQFGKDCFCDMTADQANTLRAQFRDAWNNTHRSVLASSETAIGYGGPDRALTPGVHGQA